MRVYLSSYYPLICTAAGSIASKKYNLLPYIDGSCRREPDFEHNYPCITGLCRPNFSKKLATGDLVIYLANKKGMGNSRIIAILEVIHKTDSHKDAAKWYLSKNQALPNNLIVKNNHPFPLDKTHRMIGCDRCITDNDTIEKWDDGYRERAEEQPAVAICKIWEKFLFLTNPPVLSKTNKENIFGRIPATRSPPALTEPEWAKFKKFIKV